MTGITRRALLPASAVMLGASTLAIPGSAQLLVDRVSGTTLSPGIHRIATNTTIKGDLMLQPGATIEIADGRTLTLLAGLIAPIASIFTGPGIVDLNRSRVACAHPEWWGALPGDGTHNNLPALRACLHAHPVTQLLAADYYISSTFVVDRPFSRIMGSGFRGVSSGHGTRIIVTSGTADVVRAGPIVSPAATNDFFQSIAIHSVALTRSVAVDTAGGVLPAGLRAQFLLFADFQQVSAFEHGVGFVAHGLVRSTFTDCVAFRSIPGRQAGQPYRGFLLDGSPTIGLPGGNASLFLIGCNATIGGDPRVTDAVGLSLEGAFADRFVSAFESTSIATGIRIDGKTAAIGGRARSGHVNLHLHMPIIDQCGQAGIDIRDTSPQSLIDIVDPYIAVAPTAKAALHFHAMRGNASVTGGQFIGSTNMDAHGSAFGITATESRGLQVSGLKILEHRRPVALTQCNGFSLRLAIANPDSRPGGSSVTLRDCGSGTVDILVSGQERAFTSGVRIDCRSSRLRIDATGIDAIAVGGVANRVLAADRPLDVPSRTPDLIVEGI